MAEDKRIVGREYLSVSRSILDDDGYWTAINEIHDKVLYQGETEWVDEKIESMSINRDPTEAIQTAMGSCLNYLLQNVYNSGFKGLVEFREYERQVEAAKQEKVLAQEG